MFFAVRLLAVLFLGVSPSLAAEPTVVIENGQFVVDRQPVPPGCFQRLMTELNGDDITRSVYLTRSSIRGCINSNDPGRDVDYSIVADKSNGIFDVKVCERVDGSMGADCTTLIIQFAVHSYILGDEVKDVFSLDKLGEK